MMNAINARMALTWLFETPADDLQELASRINSLEVQHAFLRNALSAENPTIRRKLSSNIAKIGLQIANLREEKEELEIYLTM